jgi:N-dimethylarginine dimethylaminohydrolase
MVVAKVFGVEVEALELVDPRFYHMDTALSPLPGGEVLYYPGAFSPEGLAAITARVAADKRIEIGEEDATRLAGNAVAIGNTLVMSSCGAELRAELARRGYEVIEVGLDSFLRSGGSAFCLTLRLDLQAAPTGKADRKLAAAAL